MTISLEEWGDKLIREAMPIPDTGCFICLGCHHDKNDYGRVHINNYPQAAHRVVYQYKKGPIPKGLFVLHSCDTPACVNPEHLRLGTLQDNQRDKMAKGRQAKPKGIKHGMAKLDDEKIRHIRKLCDTKMLYHRDIAKLFDVTRECIGSISRRKRWSHIV